MNLLYLDFETHYEPHGDYSLTKMPTMAYVRDDRFECLGVALAGANLTAWVPGPRVAVDLAGIDWPNTIAVAHNAAFDGAVLAERFGHRPAFWLDTQSWTRYTIAQGKLPPDASTSIKAWGERLGLHKGDTEQAVGAGGDELAAYGVRDVEIMMQAFDWLQRHCPLPDLEARVIDLHVRMAAEPVLELDVLMLERLAADTLDPDIAKVVRSRDKFAAALRACGVEPETKTSPANGKQTYAFAKTDRFMKRLEHHPEPRVRLLHELKLAGGSTIVATRSQRLLDVGSPMPVPLKYYGAHTGRPSGADMLNMLNFPRGDFRNALVAPDGHLLVAADYSQIEARVVAWDSGEAAALAPFQTGRDPYKEVAAEMFNCAYEDVTDEQRRLIKPVVLGLGFFMSANGLMAYSEQFGVNLDARQATDYTDRWHHTRPVWHKWGKDLHRQAVADGRITLPSGRIIDYPDIEREGRNYTQYRQKEFSKSRGRDPVNFWHGLVVENRTQAIARDIMVHAMVQMPARVINYPYDEVVLCVPERDVERLLPAIERTMLTLPDWAEGLPVACEIEVGKTYGECK